MRGGGSGGIFEALPMPLGSTPTLFMPPTLAGPGGTPLMDVFPVPASPACLAEEAAGVATTMSSMKRTFGEVLNTMILQDLSPLVWRRRRPLLVSMPLNSDLVQPGKEPARTRPASAGCFLSRSNRRGQDEISFNLRSRPLGFIARRDSIKLVYVIELLFSGTRVAQAYLRSALSFRAEKARILNSLLSIHGEDKP